MKNFEVTSPDGQLILLHQNTMKMIMMKKMKIIPLIGKLTLLILKTAKAMTLWLLMPHPTRVYKNGQVGNSEEAMQKTKITEDGLVRNVTNKKRRNNMMSIQKQKNEPGQKANGAGLGNNRVRPVAMSATNGLMRGM